MVCRPACQPASQPAVRPDCARCRAPKITQINRLLRWIYESVVPNTIFLLRHGDSFVLPYIAFCRVIFVIVNYVLLRMRN